MNPRVLGLAQAAGLISNFSSAPNRPDIERFVELVVEELVHAGNQYWLNNHSTVPTFPAKQLFQHFGLTK